MQVEPLETRIALAGLVMEQSVFDANLFAQNIEEQIAVDPFGPNGVVGYSYAIIDGDPQNPISDAGVGTFKGYARMPQDGVFGAPIPKSPAVPQAIASTSKPITAAAILHLLQEQVLADPDTYPDFEAGMQQKLDQNIVNFLPQNWGPGSGAGWTPFFNKITIRELLTHTSGLLGDDNSASGGVDSTPGNFYSGGGNRYNYAGLQQIAENGIVNVVLNPDDGTTSWPADYWTNNFSWFRVMLPYMWDEISNNELNLNAQGNPVLMFVLAPDNDLAQDLRDAIREDWGIEQPINDSYAITPAQLTSTIFTYYLTKYVLEPSGVENPQTNSSGPYPTLFYPLVPGSTPGVDPSDPSTAAFTNDIVGDQRFNLGPRSLFLSAEDLTRAITGIRHGATDGTPILLQATRDLMDSGTLGWATGNQSGLFGTYYDHSGGNFRPESGGPVMNNTHVMAFPNDVEVSIQINSQIQATGSAPTVIGAAFNPTSTPTTTGKGQMLVDAYDNAWTELVYDGSNLDDDAFFVRTNTSNSAYVDIVHQIPFITGPLTVATITRRADTLHKLTLNGNGGNDTYNIVSLPAGMELVINGGTGLDTVTVGGPAGGPFNLDNAPGTLTFNGGPGLNSLTIDDSNQGASSTYFVRDDEVTRLGAGSYGYNEVQFVTLNAGNANDDIFVESANSSTITTIKGQNGTDTVTVGGAHIDFVQGFVNVILDGPNDDLILSDIFSGSGHDYQIDSDQIVIDGNVTIAHDANDITMYSGLADNDIAVNSLKFAQDLVVNTSVGENNVSINLLGNPLTTSVLGEVTVHGGSGDDDTLTVNDATSLNGANYTIASSTVGRAGIQTIAYDGIETLNVNGAIPASTYEIRSTSAATNVTGGIAGDTFDVGFVERLAFINGFLTINGGDNVVGEDTVLIDDRLGTSPLYGLVNNALFGFNFATIFLNDVEQATINANAFDNQILIENAYGPTRYTVNGWFGVDTFSVAEGTRNLATFHTPLILNGGPIEDNHLYLYDDASPGSFSYTVTENSVDRLLFGEHSLTNTDIGVTFSSMTSVELHMNDYSSSVDVQSTNPNTKYMFHGNDGDDTLNLNRHLDDDADPFIDIDGIAITSAAMDIEHDDFEQLNLDLGDELNTVRVHNLQSPAAINLGLGDDRLFVTPDSGNLNAIHYPMIVDGQGGADRVHLLDQNYGGNAPFTVTKNSVDRFLFGPLVAPGLTYFDMDFVRLFMGSGDNVVNINTTAPGTEYLFDGGLGDDTFNVNLLPTSPLTLFGSVGDDHAVITGTEGDDEVSISAGFGTADINMPNTETAAFDGLGGADVLVAEGVVGMAEQMEIAASTTAAAGNLRITTTTPRGSSLLDLVFANTEILDLVANPETDSALMDTAAFIGTDQDDQFEIGLAAAGTNDDPVLQLFELAGLVPLLTLRDYRNFAALDVRGEDGADVFNVFVAPTGPGNGRNLSIVGGAPAGPGNPKDELNVFYQKPPQPVIDHDFDPLGDSGSVNVDYFSGLYEFLVNYEGIEKVTIKKA